MTTVAGTGGLASLQAAKEAGDAAFFATLMRNEQKREAAKIESIKAEQKPITLTLGGVAVTLSDQEARELAAELSASIELFNANPDQVFGLSNGLTATGIELSTALATLILAGKA